MNPTQKDTRSRVICMLMGVALLSMPFSHAVAADSKNKQERAAQRRLQQMQQKFEQDKAALEQEKVTIKEQLKKGETKLAAVQKALSKQKQETSRLQAENSEKDTQLATKDTQLASYQREAESAQLAARNKLAAKQQELDEAMRNLQQSEALNRQLNADKLRLGIEIAEQKSEVHACQVKNTNLIDMFNKMASKYEKAELKGVEPFTGLKGVEIENRFQDTRDQAEAQIYKPRK